MRGPSLFRALVHRAHSPERVVSGAHNRVAHLTIRSHRRDPNNTASAALGHGCGHAVRAIVVAAVIPREHNIALADGADVLATPIGHGNERIRSEAPVAEAQHQGQRQALHREWEAQHQDQRKAQRKAQVQCPDCNATVAQHWLKEHRRLHCKERPKI